jgi:hypothetical protein
MEGGQLVGEVDFANSCAPEVQDGLQRAVAMLHSFWFGTGEQTFRAVLAKDPGCAIAGRGIASLLMRNPLAGAGSPPRWATWWASEVENQVRTATAWAAFARHDTGRALTLMPEAAGREDKIEKHIVTPGRLLPARPLWGTPPNRAMFPYVCWPWPPTMCSP